MEESVSAADANRKFSRILRGVRDGNSYLITAHGQAVARIVPVSNDDLAREEARSALLNRLRNQPSVDIGRWTRDELYEDSQ